VFEGMLEEDLAFEVDVGYHILPVVSLCEEEKGVVVGHMDLVNSFVLFGSFEVVLSLEDHFSMTIYGQT
jgi:hypothetical protein